MSQQTLPCTPPPPNCRGWVHFFPIGVQCFQKNVLNGKPEYFGVIKVSKVFL